MKFTKILKFKEFNAVSKINESLLSHLRIYEVEGDNIVAQVAKMLYETDNALNKNALIVIPEGKANEELLTNTLTRFLDQQQVKEDRGFSVGHYFAGEYQSGHDAWNDNSLCISLHGAMCDSERTIATAVEIMRVLDLERVLIINEISIVEVTRDENNVKPRSEFRVRRIEE